MKDVRRETDRRAKDVRRETDRRAKDVHRVKDHKATDANSRITEDRVRELIRMNVMIVATVEIIVEKMAVTAD